MDVLYCIVMNCIYTIHHTLLIYKIISVMLTTLYKLKYHGL